MVAKHHATEPCHNLNQQPRDDLREARFFRLPTPRSPPRAMPLGKRRARWQHLQRTAPLTGCSAGVTINFLDAVNPGTRLIAQAQEESAGARIALYHLSVRDESGKLVASLHATAYRKNEWFAEQ